MATQTIARDLGVPVTVTETETIVTAGARRRGRRDGVRRAPGRTNWVATGVLILGALYAVYPLLWIGFASTKTPSELFTSSTMIPSFTGGFQQNMVDLFSKNDGVFLKWSVNSIIFAGGGALLATLVSAAAGYGLAKYRFRGRGVAMIVLVAGIMVPGVMLVIPQYLLLSNLGLAGTYWSVLLPSMISPLGIFLATVYAQASVPDELIEAGRIDGANELTIFTRIAFAPMVPGLVTVFLLQFVGIWNNFLLPYVMISSENMFPITVGLYAWLNQGSTEPALYNLAIAGSFISIIPLVFIFVFMQRYWKLDLISGSLKG